jgi:hypothetical protein
MDESSNASAADVARAAMASMLHEDLTFGVTHGSWIQESKHVDGQEAANAFYYLRKDKDWLLSRVTDDDANWYEVDPDSRNLLDANKGKGRALWNAHVQRFALHGITSELVSRTITLKYMTLEQADDFTRGFMYVMGRAWSEAIMEFSGKENVVLSSMTIGTAGMLLDDEVKYQGTDYVDMMANLFRCVFLRLLR